MLSVILKVIGGIAASIAALRNVGISISTGSTVINEVLKVIEETAQTHTDYESGQAVVVATFTENGVPGYLVAVKSGGPAAQSLGL